MDQLELELSAAGAPSAPQSAQSAPGAANASAEAAAEAAVIRCTQLVVRRRGGGQRIEQCGRLVPPGSAIARCREHAATIGLTSPIWSARLETRDGLVTPLERLAAGVAAAMGRERDMWPGLDRAEAMDYAVDSLAALAVRRPELAREKVWSEPTEDGDRLAAYGFKQATRWAGSARRGIGPGRSYGLDWERQPGSPNWSVLIGTDKDGRPVSMPDAADRLSVGDPTAQTALAESLRERLAAVGLGSRYVGAVYAALDAMDQSVRGRWYVPWTQVGKQLHRPPSSVRVDVATAMRALHPYAVRERPERPKRPTQSTRPKRPTRPTLIRDALTMVQRYPAEPSLRPLPPVPTTDWRLAHDHPQAYRWLGPVTIPVTLKG